MSWRLSFPNLEQDVYEYLSGKGLERYTEAVLQRCCPAIEIGINEGEGAQVGGSHFGGLPDVPAGFVWPALEDEKLEFVAQINLAEVALADVDHLLPQAGMLYFFCANIENWSAGILPCRVLYSTVSDARALSPFAGEALLEVEYDLDKISSFPTLLPMAMFSPYVACSGQIHSYSDAADVVHTFMGEEIECGQIDALEQALDGAVPQEYCRKNVYRRGRYWLLGYDEDSDNDVPFEVALDRFHLLRGHYSRVHNTELRDWLSGKPIDRFPDSIQDWLRTVGEQIRQEQAAWRCLFCLKPDATGNPLYYLIREDALARQDFSGVYCYSTQW